MKKNNIIFYKFIIIFMIIFIGFLLAPFIFNGFSFSYLKSLVFCIGIFPLILILPVIIFSLFEDKY